MKIEKKKKKTIPLSQREKKRYLLIEILNEDVGEKDFYFGFWIELLSFFGSKGLAEINPRLVKYKDNKAILKCNRERVDDLIAGLAFIKKIRNKKVILSPSITSGTLRKVLEVANFN
jgi:RNase P/RNase MRP subunit POP5